MKNFSRENLKTPDFFSPQVAEARRFYIDLNPSEKRRLSVISGGLEHCRSDYSINRRTFPFYSIEYVARGRGELNLQGRKHLLQPGRFFSYGPGVPHHITGDKWEPLVKYFVDFAGSGALDLLRSCGLGPGQVAQVFPPHALAPLFDELIQSGLEMGGPSETLCARLLECMALKIAAVKAPMSAVETLSFARYRNCRQFIEQDFLRLHTLAQIAEECHANNAYLCRLFRRYDQQTPYQYLLRLKMNHAAASLLIPGKLVKQVSEEVGFADPFHFSRVFKRVLGLSPEAFRGIR